MGALKIVKDDVHVMTMDEIDAIFRRDRIEPSTWQETQDNRLAELQVLVSGLEKQFITADGKEKLLIMNLLSIYYKKINDLCNFRTRTIRAFSAL